MSGAFERARVLCVDDEMDLLQGLKIQLRKLADVQIAPGAEEALALMESQAPFDVVISDMRMPGLDGAQFLKKVRELSPSTERLLLTGQADMESTVSAVNDGGISRLLTKPCPKEVLNEAVATAVEKVRLRRGERELLEGTVRGTLGILGEVLGIVSPPAQQKTKRIESIVRQLALTLELEDSWRFNAAATLSQIGCVSLPLAILDRVALESNLEEAEIEAYERHPELAHELIARIPRLEEVALMVRNQLTPTSIDESTPLASWPVEDLGAEMLRVASDLDHRLTMGAGISEAISHLLAEKAHPEALVEALAGVEIEDQELIRIAITVKDLTPGMVLDEAATTHGGLVVATKGTFVTPVLVQRLANYAANGGLREPIPVWAQARGDAGDSNE